MKIAEKQAAAVISEAFPIESLTNQRKFLGDMDTLIEQGMVNLIFDMSQVKYLMTMELGSLVAAMKKARVKGGALKMVVVGEFLDNLLTLANLKGIFEIYPSEIEALETVLNDS